MDKKLRLNSSVRYLKGVGPERSKLLEELDVRTLADLLFFFPRRYENRSPIQRVSELSETGQKVCVAGRVVSSTIVRTKAGRSFFRAVIKEAGAGPVRRSSPALFVMWFNASYLASSLKPGTRLVLWGKAERSGGSFRMIHPEFEVADSGNSFHFGRVVPIYPLVEDLSQKNIRQLIYASLDEHLVLLKERLAEDRLKALGLMGLPQAVRTMHFPESGDDWRRARTRLVFDEFLCLQLAVGLRRAARQTAREELLHQTGREKVDAFIRSLEYSLTEGQKTAIEAILSDMSRPVPMNRLLQADVGSGKTVVAAAAILFAASNGFQAAFMAPTEVLARQQMFSLSRDLEPFGIRLAYVGQSAETNSDSLNRLAAGEADVAVGTHALLGKRVLFKRLGLSIVDEQHKFGVAQRAALRDQAGKPAHFLMLTATPIPRSLAMTVYGDLDVSEMRERPKGRPLIRTALTDSSGRQKVYQMMESTTREGGRVFVVCPTVSQGSTGVHNAVQVAKELGGRFPGIAIGCLHGRLRAPAKDRLVKDFQSGKIQVLVSTVIIEVGIHVPNANFIIIENAERFGMAQLHQLRGRVGRGDSEAYCFLISDSQDPDAQERLESFCRLSCGFEIAQKDLENRGHGDWIGMKQHGWAEFVLGDFVRDEALLVKARNEAAAILQTDPLLEQIKYRPLRQMMAGRFKAALTGALSE